MTSASAAFAEPFRRYHGSRVRLWKRELQKLANELGLDIVVSHLPPGTSKWNKIEHRLFSFISQNWRAKPLVSYRVIVDLISATTTKPASPCAANSTLANTPAALSSPTPRWPQSISSAPSSTASGITLSRRMLIPQSARLFPDDLLVRHRRRRPAGHETGWRRVLG